MRAKNLRRAALRAYTAVEVMMSIIVLGIGAAGVMSMQKAAIQGNNDARMIDQANAIAREWIERLRRDAMTWTTTANWSTNTWLISQIAATSNQGAFQYPSLPSVGYPGSLPDGYSPAFDVLGRDYALAGPDGGASGGPPPVFCTAIRGDVLGHDPSSPGNTALISLLRATVQVYWLRQMFAAPPGKLSCTASDVVTTNPTSVYHFVYATTALRVNEPPQ